MVLFVEFCDWAIRKSLDLDNYEDADDTETNYHQSKNTTYNPMPPIQEDPIEESISLPPQLYKVHPVTVLDIQIQEPAKFQVNG